MKTRIIGILFVLVLMVATILCLLTLNKNNQENKNSQVFSGATGEDTSIKDVDLELVSTEKNSYKESDFDFSSETEITLSDDNTKVEGTNVKVDGNTIYITGAGAYKISGTLSDGRIIVNAPKENVKIILDNANITCSYSSAIYVYKSSATMIYVSEGTINNVIDGTSYNYSDEFSSEEDEEPNSALYSKSDLIICGKGTLNVKGNFNNGITSKDTLYVKHATINVDAKNHGINGKDNSTYENANVVVTAGGDGLRSTNDKDTSLGWIRITNSNIKIDSKEDGIQVETDLVISGGTYDITSGGGVTSSNKIDNSIPGREMWGRNKSSSSSNETSMKGLKASRYILVKDNSTITINSADDAIHSNASLQIDNGTLNIKTGDDGFHADDTLTINNGTITISESYEGLEGNNIVINDGTIDITASDDGINVNGGNDSSGFGGFGGNINVQDKISNENEKSSSKKTIEASDIGLITTSSNVDNVEFARRERPSGDFMEKSGGMKRPNGSGDREFKPSDIPNFDGGSNNPPELPSDFNNSNSSSYKLIINGGTITINANGDGLDSNGSIEMNGGNVVVQGPTNGGNGAIDYNNSFTLNGGSLIAIGHSGMAQGVNSEKQGTIMITTQDMQNANTKIELKDENGKTIVETTSEKTFNNVVITSKDVEVDKTYSLYLNGTLEASEKVSLDTGSSGFGGFGGFGGMREKPNK